MTPIPHTIVPYDRARHEAFVLASWEGRREGKPPKRDRMVMRDLLKRPDVRCVVAHHPEDEETLLGWAAREGDAVLWVYVRDLYGKELREEIRAAERELRTRFAPHSCDAIAARIERLRARLTRQRGLGTALLIALGVDPSQPTPCRFWSPMGALWAARPGVHLFYSPKGQERTAA